VDHVGEQNLQLYNLFSEIAKAIHTTIIMKSPHWFEKLEELHKKAEKYQRKEDSDDGNGCGEEALVAMGVKLMP
jgi:aromatic ring-opening dioxygenase catalytic subunit (LigB family)